jgi:hypothetical protein
VLKNDPVIMSLPEMILSLGDLDDEVNVGGWDGSEDAVEEGNALGPGEEGGCIVGPSEGDAVEEGNAMGPGDKDGCIVGPSDSGSSACWRRERNEDGRDNEDEGRDRQSSVVKRLQISKEEVGWVIIVDEVKYNAE